MEFGIFINQYQHPDNSHGFGQMYEQVDLMEELNYDTASVGERHFFDWGFFDPFTCMNAIGSYSDTLEILANILILPVHHPVHLAEQIVGLDHLTNGRITIGAGVGYRKKELINFGIPMDERSSYFVEIIQVLKRLLKGERFDHNGKHFDFEDIFVKPTPVQDPRPRILGGGSADIAIKRCAYRCDGYTAQNPNVNDLEEDIRTYYDYVKEAEGGFNEKHVTAFCTAYVGETSQDAYDALDPYLPEMVKKYNSMDHPEERESSMESLKPRLLAGSPAEVADKIEEYENAGVDQLIMRMQLPGMSQESTLSSITRFGQEVLPQFK